MPIISWLVTAVAIVMGVAQEFRIDSSENLWLDYGLMALCLTIERPRPVPPEFLALSAL